MNRQRILRQLQAIINEIKLSMNDSDIEKNIDQDKFEMKFDHFLWDERAKMRTEIKMTRINVE